MLNTIKEWIKTPKVLWIIGVAVVLLALLIGVSMWNGALNRNITRLEAQAVSNALKIDTASQLADSLLEQMKMQKAQIAVIQTKNNSLIKEVTRDAYKKAYAVPSSDLLPAFNALIDCSRKRNADRQ